jgi:hypothetical protein
MEGSNMPHLIEFTQDWFAEVETLPGKLRQVSFRKGTKFVAEVHSAESETGLAACANLMMHDGTALRVPLSRFSQSVLPRAA